ncbi:MAG: M48 family metalloprotease [Thiohalophilus sp.]|uniref:M48 family metalloprotease n=1 Tax=Thiohalophilus sp. TaxID=3028392 RepID=UPI0028702453|nr:M48 family metalloprotease [Thiohalophilus sp.]MDR9436026.1 M48 family metalloprotease [Thiohalophilus sp.]
MTGWLKSLVMLTASAVALFLGGFPWLWLLYRQGWEPGTLSLPGLLTALIFAAGLISLLVPWLYCRQILKARQLQQPLSGLEQWLHTTSFRLALRREISPPRIAIYPSREFNAFALGLRRHKATLVLSEGLVHGLNPRELESVLAHEISHIANGDVQVLALLQGVLTVFIELPARMLDTLARKVWPGYAAGGAVFWASVVVLQLAGGWLASVLIMHFSRHCEYRADRQAAELVGHRQMRAALRYLDSMMTSGQGGQLAAFGLSGRLKFRFMQLFNSHPMLFERLAALRLLDDRREDKLSGHTLT